MKKKLYELRDSGCYGDGSNLSSAQLDILNDKSTYFKRERKSQFSSFLVKKHHFFVFQLYKKKSIKIFFKLKKVDAFTLLADD